MNKDLIKQQLLLKLKPRPRKVPTAQAKALLAKYGQTYKPGATTTPTSDSK
ncbi:MAG: hypothetical protein AAF773_04320 [Cyanobacteria bacterium P01_D01_bin.115]